MISTAALRHLGRRWDAVDRAADGLAADLGLLALAALFAGITAATSTLAPHRAWGAVAVWGYLIASLAVTCQLLIRRGEGASRWTGPAARAWLTWLTWCATAVVPLVIQAVERAAGRTDRAQEEVLVVESGGERLLATGSPYLSQDAIAALAPTERLLGYLPYQPGMALFGLPRAIAGDSWATDARVWFALVTAVVLGLATVLLLRTHRERAAALVRAVQFATVLPVCALTLATGGDDLPVLALCLLTLATAATNRFGAAGLAIGAAAALKLFAVPVALVLLVLACTHGVRAARRFVAGAAGLPILALLPATVVDADAVVENVIRFPLGHGLVSSPAQSPFPGYLLAAALPGGRVVAIGLLLCAGLAIAVRLAVRPPVTAAAAAAVCGAGLLTAILLMPSTRFGYLLYPAALLAWIPALGTSAAPPAGVTSGGTVESCR